MVQLSDWIALWDRASSLVKYQDAGISLHERLQKFLSEFSKLQNEALSAQKKLCEKYIVDVEKIFGSDNTYGTVLNSFVQLVQRIVDTESLISGAFEIQANGDLKLAIEDEKRRYKKWKHDREKLSSEMKSQVRIMDDEIKRYRDKYRDMLKANEEYAKVEADKSNSHLDVEKAKSNVRLKKSDFERERKDYGAALGQFNLYRSDHFNRTLPVWANTGYQLEQDRHVRTQTLFNVLYERVRVAVDRLNAVCTDLQNVSEGLDLDRDVEQLISRLRTGNPPPSDIAFVDLASAQPGCAQSYNVTDSTSDKSSTGPVYASSGMVLPPNFYNSVSAADFAVLESAGLVDPSTSNMIYAGTGSVYSAFSFNGMGAGSRRPSGTSAATCTSPSGHGTALIRRFFSRRSRHDLSQLGCDYGSSDGQTGHEVDGTSFRRSERKTKRGIRSLRRKSTNRHPDADSLGQIRTAQSTGNLSVANMRMAVDAAGEADYRYNGLIEHTERHPYPVKQMSSNGNRDLLDSSDFSDTSFESDVDAVRPEAEGSAYAATSVLVGLDRVPMNCFSSSDDPQLVQSHPQDMSVNAAAPLAESEVFSLARSGSREIGNCDPNCNLSVEGQKAPDQWTNHTDSSQKIRNGDGVHFIQPSNSVSLSTHKVITQLEKKPNESVSYGIQNGSASVQPSEPQNRRSSRLPMRPPPLSLSKKATIENSSSSLSDITAGFAKSTPPPDQAAKPTTVSSQEASQLSVNDRRQSASRKHYFARNPQSHSKFPQGTVVVVGSCTALYSFTADGFGSCYLPFEAGEKFYLLAPSPTDNTNDWLKVLRLQTCESGYIPTAYVEQESYAQPRILSVDAQTDDDQSSQNSSRTIRMNSRPPHSPNSCARTVKGSRIFAPGYGRVPGATKDTEL